eukprot:TRINITY_DN20449_c0_g1_i1.p1 TRINITY_DN20449_c0_g1~~TRINITY_DN20449_c0_g1_i1.p1  ORF type:complete len:479 (+),score=109.55 TRINITY_DN20449_c0_g1_i1:66-1502(+)
MAARLRRGVVGQNTKGKRGGDYVEKLEKALKEFSPEPAIGVDDPCGQKKGTDTNIQPKAAKRTDLASTQGNGKVKSPNLKDGPGRGKVLNVLDKMRGGFGKGAEQEKAKDKLQKFERLKKNLRKQNDALAQVAEYIQDKAVCTNQRFSNEIATLQRQLHHNVMVRINGNENMSSLQGINSQIQSEIARLKGIAEQQAAEEKSVMEDAFIRQIEAKAQELDEERRSGQNKTGEWVKKNKKLQDELDRKLAKTESKHVTNRKLSELNKALRVEYSAQEDDKIYLIKESKIVKQHNERLKCQIHELESEIASMQKSQIDLDSTAATRVELEGFMLNSFAEATSGGKISETEKLARFEEALQRGQALLEVERKNLQGVRAAHLAALSHRTELEVFLKEAINQRRHELVSKQDCSKDEVVFTEDDRRRIIERVLSKERVLQLLFEEDQRSLAGEGKQTTEDSAPELDIDELWKRWKTWTENVS